ncbi:hypothetical protein C1645_732463 [Glomus cerebriforme]|uniref:Uncharacterized protein n=1 Tax=Glomus cerebriforme TaxID=658196 RepID=A0A397TR96_9GLOM|nr:hypothetical protein C1645_732463 [Glomus cerebriforme]
MQISMLKGYDKRKILFSLFDEKLKFIYFHLVKFFLRLRVAILQQINEFSVAYKVTIWTHMLLLTECNCWAENSKGEKLAFCFSGDATSYNDCSVPEPYSITFLDTKSTDPYFVHAQVFLSLRDPKNRGPIQSDTCWKISGNRKKPSFTKLI